MSQSRQLAAIMFTDIVGYTGLMGEDEQKALELLKKNRLVQRPIIEKFKGRWLKEIGDGVLASFNTVSDAVYCAGAIQKACENEPNLKLRIGIHEAEVVFEGNDVFGDGVNIASRLEPLAPIGGILVSESVYRNLGNKKGIKTKFIREETLKNVKDPVKIYQVKVADDETPIATTTKQNVDRHKVGINRGVLISGGVIILLLAVFALYQYRIEEPSNIPKPTTEADVEKSIAVLPLSSLSTDPENQLFADGIVEDLLSRLALIDGLKVISRTSSEMYREKGTKSLPQIARELGVSYIIEGSVQRIGGKARVNIQLIDARQDAHIWSQIYDRDVQDIFKTQSDITIHVASELNTLLTAQQTTEIQKNRTDNVKAFELYQLGRFYWNKRTSEGYHTSIDYFEQAIAEDPDYGLAYAGLADTYNLMSIQKYIEKKTGRDKAVELASKALELDESLAEAHNVLASIYTYIDMDWEGAEREYLRAIDLNSNYSTAHHYYSEHLSITGRHQEARKQINTALELDPLSFVIRYVSTKLYFNRGLFNEALTENQRCYELFGDHRWTARYNFEINQQLGNGPAALEGIKRLGTITGRFEATTLDSIYQTSGLSGLLRHRIEKTDWIYSKAQLYGLLGEDEKAMDMLEKALDEGEFSIEFTFRWAFRNLHSNPRFQTLVRQVGLGGS